MSTPATMSRDTSTPLSRNKHLRNWVEKMAALTRPDSIHWVDGSPIRMRPSLPGNGRNGHAPETE